MAVDFVASFYLGEKTHFPILFRLRKIERQVISSFRAYEHVLISEQRLFVLDPAYSA